MNEVLAPADEESNLVGHARRELEAIKEDPETIAGLLKVVQAFADMEHSGGSASVAIAMLNELLQFKELSPLTDNPDEWYFHGDDVWQNKRNGEAFSDDGGKTYYRLSERERESGKAPLHTSRSHLEIQAQDL